MTGLLRGIRIALALFVAGAASASAQARIEVVATFTILADMTAAIGGDRVAVTSLVGPNGDAHVFEPSPADARAIAGADIVIVNGLGFEGWIDRLIEAAAFRGPVVEASATILPHAMAGEDHGDPHAWQSIANARIYAANLAGALIGVDPAGAEVYRANLAAYLGELDAVEAEIVTTVAALPPNRRTIITSHDAFGYFAAAYGILFLAPQGISTEAEPTAADVAALIRQIRAQDIRAIFVETITDPRLIEQIAHETGAILGGPLFSDALSDLSGLAATYLAMMRHNIRTIAAALRL